MAQSSHFKPKTTHDVENGCPTYYPACLLYDESDKDLGQAISSTLERLTPGPPVFVSQDHLLGGTSILSTLAEIIQERCSKVMIIIPTLSLDEENEFALQFSRALDPAADKAKVIPIYRNKSIPRPNILRAVSGIVLGRGDTSEDIWKKLVITLFQTPHLIGEILGKLREVDDLPDLNSFSISVCAEESGTNSNSFSDANSDAEENGVLSHDTKENQTHDPSAAADNVARVHEEKPDTVSDRSVDISLSEYPRDTSASHIASPMDISVQHRRILQTSQSLTENLGTCDQTLVPESGASSLSHSCPTGDSKQKSTYHRSFSQPAKLGQPGPRKKNSSFRSLLNWFFRRNLKK